MDKKTKPTKTTPNKIKDTEKTAFTAREVAVLVENLESQFKLFGEKIQSIDDKIDGISVNQARTLERITIIEIKIISLEKRMDSLEGRMDSLENEVKEIKNILKTRIDPAEFKILQNRVITLEKQVEALIVK